MTRSTSDISGMSRNVFVRLAVGALRCALVRAIGRDRLTTVEVWPLDSGLGSHAFQQSEVFPKEKHDVTTPTSVTSC